MDEESHPSATEEFQEHGRPLNTVLSFKYLRRVLTASYDDWMEFVSNLRKDRWRWDMMSRILRQGG